MTFLVFVATTPKTNKKGFPTNKGEERIVLKPGDLFQMTPCTLSLTSLMYKDCMAGATTQYEG